MYSPAQKPPGAKAKGKRQLMMHFTCLLQRHPPDTEALWHEAKELVDRGKVAPTLNDTTLDKPYAQKIDLVTYYWSGKHQRVVRCINLRPFFGPIEKILSPTTFESMPKHRTVRAKTAISRRCLRKPGKRNFEPRFVVFQLIC